MHAHSPFSSTQVIFIQFQFIYSISGILNAWFSEIIMVCVTVIIGLRNGFLGITCTLSVRI